ncbi:hypothetical protein EK21DRAFT_94471 [Setomelanomma holmii]|uniref:Uncharacterized protein n=1 Tax=Setomelanomma holmii TaxID=210430 RepID=A0A9P4LG85_9PLEO|nr:hypothetical protein EK21DRAFT_94471 [Setomelanomma holmii]
MMERFLHSVRSTNGNQSRMTCRDEHPTHHNQAPALRLQYRLERISHNWVVRRIREQNRRIRERNKARRQFRAAKVELKRKVRSWKKDMNELIRTLKDLEQRWRANTSFVTTQDWDTAVEDKGKKMQILFGKKYPKEQWPKGVTYLNMITLMEYEQKEEKKGASKRGVEAKKKSEAKKTAKTLKQAPTSDQTEIATKSRGSAILPIRPAVVPTPWSRTPLAPDLSVEEQIRQLEFSAAKAEQQFEYLGRSQVVGPHAVGYDQWMKAVEGTDALETDWKIRGLVELARRRQMGELCDGWAFESLAASSFETCSADTWTGFSVDTIALYQREHFAQP